MLSPWRTSAHLVRFQARCTKWIWEWPAPKGESIWQTDAIIFCYVPRTGFLLLCTMFLAMPATLEMNAQTLRHLSAPVVSSPNVTLQQWSPIRHCCVQEMFQEDHRLSSVAECLHEARSRWQLGHCCDPCSGYVGSFFLTQCFVHCPVASLTIFSLSSITSVQRSPGTLSLLNLLLIGHSMSCAGVWVSAWMPYHFRPGEFVDVYWKEERQGAVSGGETAHPHTKRAYQRHCDWCRYSCGSNSPFRHQVHRS